MSQAIPFEMSNHSTEDDNIEIIETMRIEEVAELIRNLDCDHDGIKKHIFRVIYEENDCGFGINPVNLIYNKELVLKTFGELRDATQ